MVANKLQLNYGIALMYVYGHISFMLKGTYEQEKSYFYAWDWQEAVSKKGFVERVFF